MARRLIVGVAVLLIVALPRAGFAQQSIDSASVGVSSLDSSGGAIAGAAVTIVHVERNQRRVERTDEHGRFTFLYLPPGTYELLVQSAGFDSRKLSMTLTAGQAVDVPVVLSISGLSASVEVMSDVPLVDTRRTQATGTIRPFDIDALPLNGRNYLDLALLTPGVSRTIQRNTERFAETSAVPGTGISVAGQRNLNNTFIVDGLSANDDAAGLAGTYFSEEVIREFQVVTSGGIAEFGRASSGIVSIVT